MIGYLITYDLQDPGKNQNQALKTALLSEPDFSDELLGSDGGETLPETTLFFPSTTIGYEAIVLDRVRQIAARNGAAIAVITVVSVSQFSTWTNSEHTNAKLCENGEHPFLHLSRPTDWTE